MLLSIYGHDALSYGEFNELSRVMDIKLCHDLLLVIMNRLDTEMKSAGDIFRFFTVGDKLQYLSLAGR